MTTVAQAIVKGFKSEGITHVFGVPGVTICPLFDALADSGIQVVLTRSEQAAGHAASGFARISGKPGVCLCTSGPGAVNVLTAVATAYMDSVPLVIITGQVQSDLIGRDVFQEADITGACEPFTKHSVLCEDPDSILRILREGFHIASTGRPGPVLIDVPVDILRAPTACVKYPESVDIPGYKPVTEGHIVQIKKAAKALNDAERPLICVGGGASSSHASALIRSLSEKAGIPVIHTLMGVDAVSHENRLCLGMIGRYGTGRANHALSSADTVLLCGARVGDRSFGNTEVARDAKVIHIDIDPAEIGKNIKTSIPIVGDLERVLTSLLPLVSETRHEHWPTGCEQSDSPVSCAAPAVLLRAACAQMPAGSIVTADVGQNQIWAAGAFSVANGRFLTSGGMGTMGYSLPAAVGAALASSGPVLCVCGDGGFQMSLSELATAARLALPIKIILFDNHVLGMIREHQDLVYHGRHIAVDMDGNPDFAKLASAYGIPSFYSGRTDNPDAYVKELFEVPGPALLVRQTDPKLPTDLNQ